MNEKWHSGKSCKRNMCEHNLYEYIKLVERNLPGTKTERDRPEQTSRAEPSHKQLRETGIKYGKRFHQESTQLKEHAAS